MKIRGTTLTTPIARHAIPDDSAVSSKPWSSQNTVDKLCPSFTESGSIITCQPVEGYPLEVAWQTKNLFNDVAWYESHGFTQQEDGSWLGYGVNKTCFTNTEKRPGAMYLTATMKTDVTTTPFYLIAYYTDGTVSPTLAASIPGETFTTKTLTTDPTKTVDYIKWTYGGGGFYYLKDVMISFVDHVYEPYAETANIIRYGKNIVNLDSMLNNRLTKDENGIYHLSGASGASGVWRFDIPIPANTPITFTFLDLKGQSPGRNALIYFSQAFADGTQGPGMWFGTSEAFPSKATLRYNSELLRFAIVPYGTAEGYYCEFSGLQVEIGETSTAYEPYREGDAVQAGQQIVALPGVNTFLADSGIITVSGKANPAAEIEKLKNAILAMGANV